MSKHWTTLRWPGIALAATVGSIALLVAPCCSVTEPNDVAPAGTFRTTDLIVDNAASVAGVLTVGSCVGCGGGVTNSAGANVVPISNGANLIGPTTSTQMLVNGPTLQSFNIPNTSYVYGEVNREEIGGVVPAFPADLFVRVIRNSATADTTTHTQRSGGLAVETTGTRSAGALDMYNIAIECQAKNAQVNNCLEALDGDIVADTGNIYTNVGYILSASFLAAVGGSVFAEYGGTNAIDITSTPTNAIKTRAVTNQFDVENASATTLTFYNANAGKLRVQFGLDATPTNLNIISAIAPTSANHGTLSTRATDWSGRITTIGANTSVTLTYSSTFPHGSECTANPIAHGVSAQFIESPGSAASVTFSCFTTTTGAAANCDDFSYSCVGN